MGLETVLEAFLTDLTNIRHRNTRMLALAAIVFIAVFQSLNTQPIVGQNVDEANYFRSGGQMLTGFHDFHLDHQTARWGVILPMALARLIPAGDFIAYLLVPLLVCVLLGWMLFCVAERLSPGAGFWAVVGLAVFPGDQGLGLMAQHRDFRHVLSQRGDFDPSSGQGAPDGYGRRDSPRGRSVLFGLPQPGHLALRVFGVCRFALT